MTSDQNAPWLFTGHLAESWETPDDTTVVFNIRQGVHYHDKAPVNGRELTAQDVEYNFHRLLGLGSGFTEPSPQTWGILTLPIESVTATDKWTVEIKLSRPDLRALSFLLGDAHGIVYPPEIIEEHGNAEDWRTIVGTGPWMLTDWVEAASLTWVKNPNYWKDDEKFPGNRLPYADELKAVFMTEDATKLSAMRTGKIDWIGTVGSSMIFSVDLAVSLKETNPEVNLWPYSFRSGYSVFLQVQQPPFDDLRVRQAMHMALDFETINETYFKGYADWVPQGAIGKGNVEYHTPFEEWPEELQKTYSYDPEGAEALLDVAGYPRGADGMRFTTTLTQAERFDLGYKELAAAYLAAIGVDVVIDSVSDGEWVDVLVARTADGMIDYWALGLGEDGDATAATGYFRSDNQYNAGGVSDPVFEAIHDKALAATTHEERIKWAKEANMYATAQHWIIWGPRAPQFHITQPWLIGYNGEFGLGRAGHNNIPARVWIDHELKGAIGF